jgi:hypothetical protein
MEKVSVFISGVRALLPGIVVAVIFYLYSNAKFDQFFFIMFCVIFVGLIGLISAFVGGVVRYTLTALLISLRWILRSPMARLPKIGPRLSLAGLKVPSSASLDSMVGPAQAARARSGIEFLVAIALGLLLVKTYESDLSFRVVSRVMRTLKVSDKDPLNFVGNNIAQGAWDRIDQRPRNRKFCNRGDSECTDGVYARVTPKGENDVYEGAFFYYSLMGERLGMYLSPACVKRRIDGGKSELLEVIPGPGVYVNLEEVYSIEYLAIRDSRCFRLFYPSWDH